jgi:hypothetical protein
MTARRVDDQSAECLQPDRLDTLLLHVDDHGASARFALPQHLVSVHLKFGICVYDTDVSPLDH